MADEVGGMMEPYPPGIEVSMKMFYNTLSEKDKRRYAAIEAKKLGHGGISYIAQVLACSRTTIHEGLNELESLTEASSYEPALRRSGGGRKPYEQTIAQIDEAFLTVIEPNLAGDPMDEQNRWTNLSYADIQAGLAEQHQIEVSDTVIKQLLAKHKLRRRKGQKNAA